MSDVFEKRMFLILIFISGIISVGTIVGAIILMGILSELESVSSSLWRIAFQL